jgi:hypothetical protein
MRSCSARWHRASRPTAARLCDRVPALRRMACRRCRELQSQREHVVEMPAPDLAQAIRFDGNVPIDMMPTGLADAAMAAVSYPMSWSPSKKATPFLEDSVLVSVMCVIINALHNAFAELRKWNERSNAEHFSGWVRHLPRNTTEPSEPWREQRDAATRLVQFLSWL